MTQDRLGGDLEDLEDAGPTAAREARAEQPARRAAGGSRSSRRSLKRASTEGEAAGRIRIPRDRRELRRRRRHGGRATLRKGPGFFPETPFPGARGTTAIAGHRTTYGAPFRRRRRPRQGRRRSSSRCPTARFTYEVERTRIVEPDALWVLDARRLRPPGPLGVPSAVQRGAAHRRLRAARDGAAGRVPGHLVERRIGRRPDGACRRRRRRERTAVDGSADAGQGPEATASRARVRGRLPRGRRGVPRPSRRCSNPLERRARRGRPSEHDPGRSRGSRARPGVNGRPAGRRRSSS